jgi:hypothetical protein
MKSLRTVVASAGKHRFSVAATDSAGNAGGTPKRWLQRFSAEAHPNLNEVLMAGVALAELGRTPSSAVARDTLERLASI